MACAEYSDIVETIKPLLYNEVWVEDPVLKKAARLAATMYEIENVKVQEALVGKDAFSAIFLDARVYTFRQVYVF